MSEVQTREDGFYRYCLGMGTFGPWLPPVPRPLPQVMKWLIAPTYGDGAKDGIPMPSIVPVTHIDSRTGVMTIAERDHTGAMPYRIRRGSNFDFGHWGFKDAPSVKRSNNPEREQGPKFFGFMFGFDPGDEDDGDGQGVKR